MTTPAKPALPEPDAYMPARHAIDCALFDPSPGNCDCGRRGPPLWGVKKVRTAIDAAVAEARAFLPCGHPASLMLRSAETGAPLYCELCDAQSGRRDAEAMETELRQQLARARAGWERECDDTDKLLRGLGLEPEICRTEGGSLNVGRTLDLLAEARGVPKQAFGIIDPDYARVFTQARILAWQHGYACLAHGSFTRDLDLLLVPWTDAAQADDVDYFAPRIAEAAGLKVSPHPPSAKPHGRKTWTLLFPGFSDARWVDLSVLTPLTATPSPAEQPKPAVPEPTRSQKLADAGFTRRPSLWAMQAREALELIAAPRRPDGTWNRDREACRQLAAEALGRDPDDQIPAPAEQPKLATGPDGHLAPASEGSPGGAVVELPDRIRVPLHRLWADAGYLIGRARNGETDLAVHTIKALCDELERAIRAALASKGEAK